MIAAERVPSGKVRLLSIVSNMHGGAGHHIPYHTAVSRAAEMVGWSHRVACPREDAVVPLPTNWSPSLNKRWLYYPLGSGVWWLPLKALMKAYGTLRFWWALLKFLRREVDSSGVTVLFVDDPAIPQMVALAACLPFIRPADLRVWAMYRTRVYERRFRVGTFRLVHRLTRSRLGGDAMRLLTDSSALAVTLRGHFRESLMVMPIPHLERFSSGSPKGQAGGEIVCWWPGAPRAEKGLLLIRSLAALQGNSSRRLRLVAAKSAELVQIPGGPRITLVPDKLPRDEYHRLMQEAVVILLPYDPEQYGERTSGIFVECVVAGKVPVVTGPTWMGEQLRLHGLSVLALDWRSPSVADSIVQAASDPEVQSRLEKMRGSYLDLHGERPFGAAMKAVLCAQALGKL